MRAKTVLMALCLFVLLASTGCFWNRTAYRRWRKENGQSAEAFAQLATEKNWKLVVEAMQGIAVLDLGHGTFEIVYKTVYKPELYQFPVSEIHAGRIAFLETQTERLKPWGQAYTYFLVVVDLECGEEVARVPMQVPNTFFSRLDMRAPVLLRDESLVFDEAGEAVLYDFTSKKKTMLLPERPDFAIVMIREGNSYFYVVREKIHYQTETVWPNDEIVILSAEPPYEVVATHPGVRNVLVVGDRTVIEKEKKIYELHPHDGDMRPLTDGALLNVVDDNTFLHTGTDQGNFTALLMVYRFSKGRSVELPTTARTQSLYYHQDVLPIILPDASGVIVSRLYASFFHHGHAEEFDYRLYDLESGCYMASVFYDPYLGKHWLRKVLGWIE